MIRDERTQGIGEDSVLPDDCVFVRQGKVTCTIDRSPNGSSIVLYLKITQRVAFAAISCCRFALHDPCSRPSWSSWTPQPRANILHVLFVHILTESSTSALIQTPKEIFLCVIELHKEMRGPDKMSYDSVLCRNAAKPNTKSRYTANRI